MRPRGYNNDNKLKKKVTKHLKIWQTMRQDNSTDQDF